MNKNNIKRCRAWHKKIKKYYEVEYVNFSQRKAALIGFPWGTWHNYSKRGDVILEWNIFIDGKEYFEGDILFCEKSEREFVIEWNDYSYGYQIKDIENNFFYHPENFPNKEKIGTINERKIEGKDGR